MGDKTKLKLVKVKAKPNGPGAPLGSSNGLKSGAFANLANIERNIDGRTPIGKALKAIEAELVTAVGSDPTPQEILLIQRIKFKTVRCALFEIATLTGQGISRDDTYLAWANSLRCDLQAIGLGRRANKIIDLGRYIAEQEDKPNEK